MEGAAAVVSGSSETMNCPAPGALGRFMNESAASVLAACGEMEVRPGARNTGRHDGSGFAQWISSSTLQRTLTQPGRDQPGIDATRRDAVGIAVRYPDVYLLLEQARW